jgi:broad specificity phosphatase PhoE
VTQESEGDFVKVIFETHSTSLDNEAGIASGHNDVDLSEIGFRQAKGLGELYAGESIAAVICSDLMRSYRTAEIAFGSGSMLILRDPRMRECDYGSLSGFPVEIVERERSGRIHQPFPDGESYTQVVERVRNLLSDIVGRFRGQRLLLIGHRATWYSLEHLLAGVPLLEAIEMPWVWQPGWTYLLASSQVATTCHQEIVKPGDASSI